MHSDLSKGMQNIWEIQRFCACGSIRETMLTNTTPILSIRFTLRPKVTRSSWPDLTQCPLTQICVAQHRSVLCNTDLCYGRFAFLINQKNRKVRIFLIFRNPGKVENVKQNKLFCVVGVLWAPTTRPQHAHNTEKLLAPEGFAFSEISKTEKLEIFPILRNPQKVENRSEEHTSELQSPQ